MRRQQASEYENVSDLAGVFPSPKISCTLHILSDSSVINSKWVTHSWVYQVYFDLHQRSGTTGCKQRCWERPALINSLHANSDNERHNYIYTPAPCRVTPKPVVQHCWAGENVWPNTGKQIGCILPLTECTKHISGHKCLMTYIYGNLNSCVWLIAELNQLSYDLHKYLCILHHIMYLSNKVFLTLCVFLCVYKLTGRIIEF